MTRGDDFQSVSAPVTELIIRIVVHVLVMSALITALCCTSKVLHIFSIQHDTFSEESSYCSNNNLMFACLSLQATRNLKNPEI